MYRGNVLHSNSTSSYSIFEIPSSWFSAQARHYWGILIFRRVRLVYKFNSNKYLEYRSFNWSQFCYEWRRNLTSISSDRHINDPPVLQSRIYWLSDRKKILSRAAKISVAAFKAPWAQEKVLNNTTLMSPESEMEYKSNSKIN